MKLEMGSGWDAVCSRIRFQSIAGDGRRRRAFHSAARVAVGLAVGLALSSQAAFAAVSDQSKPGGHWQVPGEIQQPKGNWQVPGEIQKPGEIQTVAETCRTRLVVGADALFEFDKAELSAAAEASLAVLGPRIQELSGASKKAPKTTIEGHTDAKGDDAYNDGLSERRAKAVRSWLAARGFVAAETPILGFGERHPVAPNERADGSDDPEGRAKNRRVEVVLATCEP